MTRNLRFLHRLLWPLLALTIGAMFATALLLRPIEEPPSATEADKK